jgi:hypothetical protein
MARKIRSDAKIGSLLNPDFRFDRGTLFRSTGVEP